MGSSTEPPCHVLHVSNICPSVTREQVYQLFIHIGRIDDLKLYPTDSSTNVTQKIAYVKFEDDSSSYRVRPSRI
uniref:RRM domain-containing protein n=1 Tax=Steinernema glaseri TaxID=37863 RepID=A0A1I7ZN32_9BILA